MEDVPVSPVDRELLSLPPPPPKEDDDRGQVDLPPPPKGDDDRRQVDLPPPPPPPPEGYDGCSVQRKRGRSPEGVPPLPPPPPPGSSRLSDRLEGPVSRSTRPPEPRSIWRRLSPVSPPPRSPSPVPPKRQRLDDGGGRRSASRAGRFKGRGRDTSHRAPDRFDYGSGASSNAQGHTQSVGLMSYKQFTQGLEDNITPGEATSRYQEYKTAYMTTQKQLYFDLHKNEDWLKDMYHPVNLLSVIESGPEMTASAASKSGNGRDEISEDDGDYSNKRSHHRGPLKESDPLSLAPKAHPASLHNQRIQTDIDQALALVQKLDDEKGIVGNILSTGDHGNSDVDKSHAGSMGPIVLVRGLNTVKGLEGVELLDTLLTYLWRVHGVDYYGMSESNNANGLRHVRADKKSGLTSRSSAVAWEKKLDSFWQERLTNGRDPLVALTAKDKIEASTDKILETYFRKIEDDKCGWKYGCGAKGCTKIFHAPEFVLKHLNLKHSDLVSMLTLRVQEDIYFQNYMNDPNAPGGTPAMQQSSPKKPPELMFGASGEQGSSAPFAVEFPIPPVLMPLPGAGPLGPFVPAPPEVVMQMMRKQGSQHGLNTVGPMLPTYPSCTLDPRPLRSYSDLDAPEEESTAIDKRSL